MKYVDEYRDPRLAGHLLGEIRRALTRPWTIMEVCGGQTHALFRSGIDGMLPEGLRVLHGPGCPVCVTPLESIDRALAIAVLPGVTFCSFGDMLRVPGSKTNLLQARAAGGDVRIVYSPLDAVRIARENPARQVVFFAVGFETTAPATALAARQARLLRLTNFSLLVAHVLVPPALELILSSPDNRVQGLLAAGHVCTVAGYDPKKDAFAYAADLVTFIRSRTNLPDARGFGIGVAGFPEGHPATPNRLKEMDNLEAKIDTGADYICTQLFFENRDFYDFRERCEQAGIRVPILAGIMPVSSRSGMTRMAELALGARFPARLLKAVDRCADDEAVNRVGVHWATEQCRDLLDNGVRGIHFYTLNRSDATRQIYQNLGVKDSAALRAG